MSVLEKILEEIEERIKKLKEADNMCRVNAEHNRNFESVKYFQSLMFATERAESIIGDIIHSHMDEVENGGWISDNQPKDEERVLVSFENFNEVLTARYKAEEEGGTFLLDADDADESFVSHDLYVSAWQPLPDRYKGE